MHAMHHPARHRRPALSRNFFNAIMAGSLVLMGWLSFASFHAIEPVFHSHWHPGATGGGRGAGASDVVTAPGPVPLVPEFGLKEPPVDAQQSCHAHAHVDAYGEALVSGDRHIKSTPGECCAACRAYNGTGNPCNVWVFCGDKAKCGATFGQCWLKYTKPAIALQMLQHGGAKEVPWISGLSLDKPIEEYINQATNDRAARMRSELTLVASKHLTVGLRNETGTVEFLSPAELPSFSYVLPLDDPNVLLTATTHLDRRGNNYHHLGDVSLRVKTARYGDASIRCSTVHSGALKENATAAASLAAGGGGALQEGAAAGGWLWRHSRELAPKIYDNPMQRVPVGDCPVELTRHIVAEPESLGGAIQIRFELRNPASAAGPTTVTDLGIPMPFDHHFAGRTLVQVANQCSFVEPFLGAGGGYIQVARASGGGPVLLLLPLAGTEVENWRPLREEDQMQPGFMYEHTYEVLLHSSGFAGREWKDAKQWNEPTSLTLKPGESRTYGFRLLLAPTLRDVEATLVRAGHPVARLLPGPVLSADMVSAALSVSVPEGYGESVGVTVDPPGAVELLPQPCERVTKAGGVVPGSSLLRCPLRRLTAPADGRVRLTLEFQTGGAASTARSAAADAPARPEPAPLRLTAHVFITQPARDLVTAFGAHGATRGYVPVGTADPWHRDGAFFGWDAEKNATVFQERRVYMSGLSDEAGASAPLAMAVKQVGAPSQFEVDRLEEFIEETVWQGDNKDRNSFLQASKDHSIRLSMLYWNDELNNGTSPKAKAAEAAAPDLAKICKACWPKQCSWMECWTEEHSLETWRAYNYPHYTTVYWALYRMARWQSPPLAKRKSWQWYLTRAHGTAMALWTRGGDPWSKRQGDGIGTSQWGVMVGSVFEILLTDLLREGWVEQAKQLQNTVERRMGVWLRMPFPYGSEFPFDNTGHEEIATWMLRFNLTAEARQTADAITAFSSLVPHWAYCGSARRWWDFVINGRTVRGNERTFHHYAAQLNSVPLFDHAVRDPTDSWLWRLAGCGGNGFLTNIRPEDGTASMGWHGDPDMLSRDAYSADFGPGFFGHWKNAGGYLVCSAELGWVCIACDVEAIPAGSPLGDCATPPPGGLRVTPRDAFRRRLYLQPLGVMMTVDGGSVEAVEVRPGGAGAGGGAPAAASVRLAASPAGVSTHALVTLRADGEQAGGRRFRMTCEAPCAFEPSIFPGGGVAGAAEDVFRLRFGSREGATVELVAAGAAAAGG